MDRSVLNIILLFVVLQTHMKVSLSSPVSSALSKLNSVEEIPSSEYDYSIEENPPEYSSEEEDQNCPPTHFYHIRGHHCVPFKCPKSNSLRDYYTGDCLYGNNGELLNSSWRHPLKKSTWRHRTISSSHHSPKLTYSRSRSIATRSTFPIETKRVKVYVDY